jgi:hypothetical protein
MEPITVSIPAIDDALIANLETTNVELGANEVAAVVAIRERFTQYAKHNGYIKIAWSSAGNQNWSNEEEEFYERDGKQVHGLLVADSFSRERDSEFRGRLTGFRLYLTDYGWIELERRGSFSQWQGEPQSWEAKVRDLSDEQVATEYDLLGIAHGLATALKTMAEKLPERYTKLRQKSEFTAKLIEALKQA